MRIPNQVLFLGKRRWPEFDCSEAPLPDRFILKLWMLDGAERRYHLAKRWLLGWHKSHLEQLRKILIAAGDLPPFGSADRGESPVRLRH